MNPSSSKTCSLLLALVLAGLLWGQGDRVGAAAALSKPVPLDTFLNGQVVPGDGRAVMVNGVVLVPLYVLAERLGMTSGWLEETRTVRLDAFGKVIYLPVDGKVALVDGQSVRLAEAAQVVGNRTAVPLRFLTEVLGFQVDYQGTKRRVDIRAPEYAVTDIRFERREGRPRIVITGSRPPRMSVSVRQNPLRYVVDLAGARLLGLPGGRLSTDDPLLPEVSWKQEKVDLARLTLPAGREMPWSVETSGDRTELVFPPQVRSFDLVVDQGRRYLVLKGTAPLKPVVRRLAEPDRLVIDVPGAVWAGPSHLPLADPWVEGLRMGQLDADTVRVVADLAGPLAWAEEPGGAGAGEDVFTLHLYNRVVGLTFQTFKDRTQLKVRTAVETLPSVARTGREGRLEVALAETSAEGLPAEVKVGDGTIDRLRLLQTAPGTVRWAVELPYYVGHQVMTGKGNEAVIEVSRSPVYRKRIFLDPGHGGADPGAIGPGGLMEKEANLDLALKLRDVLVEAGAEVFLSRESDVFVPLYDRPRAANALKAAAFVSLHANASYKPTEGGTEVYFHPDRPGSRDLAAQIQKKLVGELNLFDRTIKANREFVVTREAAMPAVLVELAFVSNPAEERLLGDPLFRQRAAEAVADGILGYFAQLLKTGGDSATQTADQ